MTEKIPVYIKADDVIVLDTKLPAEAVKFEVPAWTCPVCGLNRNKGNHQECSKITQLKRLCRKVFRNQGQCTVSSN